MRRLAIVVALWCMLPVATAEPASLSSASLAVGDAALEGPLRYFASDDRRQGGGPALGTLDISARSLRIETDWERLEPSVARIFSLEAEEGVERAEFSDAQAHTTRAGAVSYLFVAPWGDVPPVARMDMQRGVVAPGAHREEAHRDWIEAGRPALVADASGALAARSDQPFELKVTGTFVATIWDVDLTVRGTDGQTDVWTGASQEDNGLADRQQQAYLFIEDGELRVRVGHPDRARLAVATPSLAADGAVTMHEARGLLATSQGRVALEGQTVQLAGPVRLRLGTPEPMIPVSIVAAAGANFEGQTIGLATTPSQASLHWTLAALATIPLLGALAVRLSRASRYRRLNAAMAEGDYDRALRHAHKLLRSRRHRNEAAVAHTVGLLRLRRADEALAFLDTNPRGDPALREYLRAFAHALKQDWDQAAQLVTRCIAMNPALETEVTANRVFRPLWGRFGASTEFA